MTEPHAFEGGHASPNLYHKLDRVDGLVHEETNSGCWLLESAPNSNGYGRIQIDGVRGLAHRVMYEHHVGTVPEGLDLDHLCRNRECCNPSHLEPVTRRENLMRGETIPAMHAAKTHCKRGHEFSPENTYVRKNGTRWCKRCASLRRESNKESFNG